MTEIGIILTGKKDYVIPENIWKEELEKIKTRTEEKYDDWSLKFIYEKSLESTPLLKPVLEALNSLATTSGGEYEGRITFAPVVTDWLRYKEQAGWRRDQKMVELGNYCLSFTPSLQDNMTGPHRFLLSKARKEKLVVKEISPLSSLNTKPIKPITPGSLTLNMK